MVMASTQGSLECLTRRLLHTAVLNPVGSKRFLKKLVPASISFILHQRIELDEADFSTRSYGGIHYKVFKPNLRTSMLRNANNWIKGAMDALEKNYLREIYLIFESSKEAGVIYESYKFQFKYMGTDVIPVEETAITKRDLEDNTNLMLTSIESLNHLNMYKENEINIKMALTYYEDMMPPDYQPPFFDTNRESGTFVFNALANQPPNYLRLGTMQTGYHALKCRVKGDLLSMNYSLASEEDIVTTEPSGTNEAVLNSQPITVDRSGSPSQEDNSYPILQNSQRQIFDLNDRPFRCMCNIPIKLKYIDTILCSKCVTHQHCACSGYLERIDVPDEYSCMRCRNNSDEWSPTIKETRKATSIFKLMVAVMYFTAKVPEELLKMVCAETADYVFKKLLSQKVIILDQNRIYKVNLAKIKGELLKALFFPTNQQKRKLISNSMTFEEVDMSQANSMELGGVKTKKWKHN